MFDLDHRTVGLHTFATIHVADLSTLSAGGTPMATVSVTNLQERSMKAAWTAADLCQRDVAVAFRSMVLSDAARAMRGQHVGSLVVVDETILGRIVVGMLTDRDIVTSVVAKDVDASTLRVGDVMTDDVVCVREEDSLHDVLATMQQRRVRRMPVTGPQQRLVGVISADDLLRVLVDELQHLSQLIGEQVKVEQLVRP
jgi:CBS domain-containing protein